MVMNRGKRQDGYVIVVVAALLVVLLGFAAMAVDLGMLYSARTSMQRAADAAALAGAYSFISEPLATQPTTAEDRARSTAYQNGVFGAPIQAGEVTVAVNTTLKRVTVNINRNENTFFAKALNWTLASLAVEAIAEADAVTCSTCVKPWFIPNSILSGLPPCEAGGQVLIDPSTRQVTGWAQGLINSGYQFTIKPGNPQNAAGPGEFFCIRLGDSSGGSDYETNIITCTPNPIICGNWYGVEPGNMIGPTAHGVGELVSALGTTTADRWVGVDVYRYPDTTTGPTSKQLIVAPIWNSADTSIIDCDTTSSHYNNLQGGATTVIQVLGFALLFLEGTGGSGFACEPTTTSCGNTDVIVRLINISGCGFGGGVAPDECGPLGYPLRLIRTN
jgi:hypothetical protein